MDWLIGGFGPDSEGTAAGISLAQSQPNGTLAITGLAAAVESPCWLTLAGDHVYAALHLGQVVSLRRTEHGLEVDGVAETGGIYTCSVAVLGSKVIAASYGNGVVGVIGTDAAGAVTGLEQVLPNSGSGPHPDQGNARAHAVFVTEDDAVITLDLGTDQALIHRFTGGELRRAGEFLFPAGTGPRDIAAHPSGRLAVLGELDGSIHLLDWDGTGLTAVSSAKLDGFAERTHGAGIVFSDDGRYGYTSLRRAGRIAVSRFEADTVAPAGSVDAAGPWVRHLAIEGELLHAAQEHTNELTTFRLGPDGLPVLVGSTPAPSPAFILPLLEY